MEIEKPTRVHITPIGKIKSTEGIGNHIICTFMGDGKIELDSNILPTNKVIILQNVNKALDAKVVPKFCKTTLSHGKRLTIMMSIPPYRMLTMNRVITGKVGIIDETPHKLPSFPNRLDN